MPLVTLTCSTQYYPPDEPVSLHVGFPDEKQMLIIGLANNLPRMMIDCKTQLKLGVTPEAAVQIDIKKFHAHARNAVDLWVHVQFTEPDEYFGAKGRDMARDTLAGLIRTWMKENKLKFSWALDVFFGTGTGCYSDSVGEIQQIW